MATVAVLMPNEGRVSSSGSARDTRLVEVGIGRQPEAVGQGGQMAERAVYRPSRANPAAIAASAVMILGMAACLATLNVVSAHRDSVRLTAIELRNLDATPPPPPPQPTTLEAPEVAASQAVAPKPMIELPTQGPRQVMVDAPPAPPAAPAAITIAAKAPPSAVVAPSPPPAAAVEGGNLDSKVLSAKPPAYPVDARRAHEQGVVKLLVLVGADGLVKDIKVASSSGSARLDGAALRAVRHWRWQPTISNGAAMAVRGYVTIPFVLTNQA